MASRHRDFPTSAPHGLFMIGKIGMELTQHLPHPPSLADRHIVVGISVKDIDAQPGKIS